MKVGDKLKLKSDAPASATKGLEPEMEITSLDPNGHFAELIHHRADGTTMHISANIKTLEQCCQIKRHTTSK
jgi:hypothetical protein